MPRGFDIPREQIEAGKEAYEDRLEMEDCKQYPNCGCFCGCCEKALERRAHSAEAPR